MTKNNKLVFIINGVAQSGKDEFYLAVKNSYNTENVSSIGQIREIAKSMGWDGVKDEKSRKLLSDLKDLHTEFNDGPLKYVSTKINNSTAQIVICHLREVSEIEKLKWWCVDNGIHVKTILVTRQSSSQDVPQNTGDLGALEKYDYNVRMSNDGTLHQWHKKCLMMCSTFSNLFAPKPLS